MQAVSETYTRLLSTPGVIKQHRAVIGGAEYGQEHIVGEPVSYNSLYGDAKGPTLGGVSAGELTLSILPRGIIPRMAEIRLFTRLARLDYVSQVVTESSEWLQKGVFLLDTRQKNAVTEAMDLHCYDRMLLAEDFFFQEGDALGEWPRAMEPVLTEICDRMGVELEEGTVIDPTYKVPYPEGLTMREMIGYAAACHGANATITETGALRFVPLLPAGEAVSDLGRNMQRLELGDHLEPFSGVAFYDGDTLVASAGDETGRVLEAQCPWATQQIADDVLAKVLGGVYTPWEADSALLDPAVELGDLVGVDGAQGILASRETVFNGLMTSNAGAPGDEEVEHEIPYIDKEQKRTQQAIENTQAVLWTGIDQADHLSTSQKIAKYLREDTSEDDFLRIKGLGIVWIRARTDGTEVQATDEDGHPLYWDPDVEKATVEADGWYYVGTEKVKPTIVETPYPVMCYAYEEQVIAEWKFMQVPNPDGTAAFLPTIVMGAGTDVTGLTNNGKAFLQKHFGGIDLKYQTSAGKTAGAFFRDDGFVDVVQRRASISVDTENAAIVVRPEGELADSYAINYNEDEAGNLDLIWPDGYQTRVEVL